MGIDYRAVSGFGVEVYESLLNIVLDDDPIEQIVSAFEECKNVSVAVYGSYYTGDTTICLFAVNPINRLNEFITEVNSVGLFIDDITKDDIVEISEVLVY